MSTQPRLPEGLRDITKSLTKEILRKKPRDIYGFAAAYFEAQLPRSERYSVNAYEPGQDYATLLKASSRHTQLPITLVYAIMPDRLIEFIKDFIKAVLKQSPANICHFAVQYFRHMQKERPMEMTPQDYEEYERYLKSKGRYAYPIKCMCGRWLGRATTEDVAANCQGVAKKQGTEKTLNGQGEEGFDEKSKELRGNYVKVKEVHEKIHVLKQMKALKAIDNDGKDEDTAQDEGPSSKDIQGVSKEVNGFSKGDMQSTNDKSLTSKGFNSSSKAYVYPSKNKTSLIMDSLAKDENSTSNKEETKLTPTKDEINSTTESVYTSNEVKDPSKDDKDPSNNEKDPSNDDKDTPKNEKDTSNDDKDAQNNEKDPSKDESEPSKDEKDPSNDENYEIKDNRDPSKDKQVTSMYEKDPSNEEKVSSNVSKMPTSVGKEPENTKDKIGVSKDNIDPSKDEQIPSIDNKEPSKDELSSSETEKVPSAMENISKDETGQTSQLTLSPKDVTASPKAATPSPNEPPSTTHSPNEQYLNAVHVIQRMRKCLRRRKSHFTATPPTNRLTDEMAALIIQRSVRRLFAAKQTKSIGGDHTPMQPITDPPSLIDEQSDISEATSYTSAASTVVAGQGEDKDTPAARDINDESDLLESMLLNAFNNQEELADERSKRSLEEVQGDESDLKEVPEDKTDDLLGKGEPSTEGVDEKEQQKGKNREESKTTKSAEATQGETKDTKEPVSLTEKEPAATTIEKDESEDNKKDSSPSENTERDEPPTSKASESNKIPAGQPGNDKDGVTSLKEEKEEIEKSLKVDNELPKSLEKDKVKEKYESVSEKIELKEPLEIDDKNSQQSPQLIDGQEGVKDEHLKEPTADETAAISPSAKQTATRDTPKSADPSTSAIPSASEKIATDSESAHANGAGDQGETMEIANDAPEIIVKNLVQNVSGERAISKMPEMEEGVKERNGRRPDATGNDNNDKANEENAKLQAENEQEEAKKSEDQVESQLKETRELGNEDFKGSGEPEKDQEETFGVNKAADLKELEGCKDDMKSKDSSSIEADSSSKEVVNEEPKRALENKDELNPKETTSNTLPNDDKVTKKGGEEPSTDGLNSKTLASSAGLMAAVVATQAFGMESAPNKGSQTKDLIEDLNIKASVSDVDVADKPVASKETKLDSDAPSKLAADEEDKKIFEILRAATMDDEGGPKQAEELAKEILDSVAEKINEIEKIVPERVKEEPNDGDIDDPKKEDEPLTEEPGKGAENPSEIETPSIQEEPLATTKTEEDTSNKSSTEAVLKTVTKETNDSKDTPADDSVKDDLSSQEVSLAGIMAAAVATQAFGIESKEKDTDAKAATQGDSANEESSKISSTKDDKNIDSKETAENKEDPMDEPKDKQAVVEDIIEKSICSVLTDDTLLDALADEINGTEDSKISTEKQISETIKTSEEGEAGANGGNDIDETLKAVDDSNVTENAHILTNEGPDTIENDDIVKGEESETNLEKSPIEDDTRDAALLVNGSDDADELPSNASFINLRQIVDEAIELDKETERENGKNNESMEEGGKEKISKKQDETKDSKDFEDSKSKAEEVKQKDQVKGENAKTDDVKDSKSLNSTDVKSTTENQSADTPSDKEKSETSTDSPIDVPQKEVTTEVSSSEIEDSKEPSLQAKKTEEEAAKMKISLNTTTTLNKDEVDENLKTTVGSKDEPQNNKEDLMKLDNEKTTEEIVESPVSLGEKAAIDNREADESSKNIQVAEKLSIVEAQLKGADMDEENNNDLRFNKNIAMLSSKEKDDEKSHEMDMKNAELKDKAEAKESIEKDPKLSETKSENYLFPLRAALETKDSKDNEIGRQQQQQTSTTTPTTIGTQNSPNSSSKVASSNEKSKIVATQQPPPPTQPQPTTTSLGNKLSKTHPLPSNSGSNSNLSSTSSSIVDQKIYTDKYIGLPIAEIHLKSFKAVNALEAFPWFDESKSPRPSNSDEKVEKSKEVSEAGVQVDSGEVAAVSMESLKEGTEAREAAPKEVLERREGKPNLKLNLKQSNQQEEIIEPMEKLSYSKEVTSEASPSPASIKESSSQTSEDASSKASDSSSIAPETERTATYLYGIHPAEPKKVYKPPTAFVIPFDTKRKVKGSKPKIVVPQEQPTDPTKSSEEEREDSIDLESPTKLFAELSAFHDELENDSDDLLQYSLNETRRLGDPLVTSDSSLSDMEETDGYVEGDNNDNASHLSIIMEVSECDDSPSPKPNDTSSTYDADYWEQLYMKHGKQDRNLHESGKVYNNALEHMRNESDDSLQVPSAQGRVKRSYFEKVANIPEIVKASTTIQRAYRGYAERKKKRSEDEGKDVTTSLEKNMNTSKEKEATDSESTPDLKETKKDLKISQSILPNPTSPKIKSSPSNNKEDPLFDATNRMSAEDLLQMSQASKKPQPSQTFFGNPQTMDDLKHFIEACIRIQRFYRRYVKKRPAPVNSGKDQTSVIRKASNVKPEDLRDFVEASIKIQRFFRRHVKSRQNKVAATKTTANKSLSDPTSKTEESEMKQEESTQKLKSVIEASITIQRFYRKYLLRKNRAASRNMKDNQSGAGVPQETPQEKRVDVVSLMADLPSIPSNNPSEDDDTSCSESLKSIDDSQLTYLTGACVKIQRFYRKYLNEKREIEARKMSAKKIDSINEETNIEEMQESSNLNNNSMDIQDLEQMSEACIRIQRFYRRYRKDKKQIRPLTSDSMASDVVIVPGNLDSQEIAKLSEACVKIQKFYRQHLRAKRELTAEKETLQAKKASNSDRTSPNPDKSITAPNTKDLHDLEDISEACVTIQRYYRRYVNKKRGNQQRPLTSDSMASDVVVVPGNFDSQEMAKLSEACVKIQKFYRQHLQAKREQKALQKSPEEDKLAKKDYKALETDIKSSKDLTKLSKDELDTSKVELNSKDVHDLEDLSEACVTIQRFYRQYRSKKLRKKLKRERPVTSDSVASDIVIVPGNLDTQDMAKMTEACVKIQRFYRQYKKRGSSQGETTPQRNSLQGRSRNSLQGRSRKKSTEEVVIKNSSPKIVPRDIQEQLEELTRASIAIQRFYRRSAKRKLTAQRPGTVDSLANDVIIQPYAGDINDLARLTEACVKIQRFYREYARSKNSAPTSSGGAEFIEPHNSPGAMDDAQQFADASVKIQRFYRRRLQSKNAGKLLPQQQQPEIITPTSSEVTSANKAAAPSIALPIATAAAADDVKAIDKFEALSRTPGSSAASHGLRRGSLAESSFINKRPESDRHDLQHLIEACITIQRFYRRYAATAKRRRAGQKEKFQNAARIIQRRFRAYKAGKGLTAPPLGEGDKQKEGEEGLRKIPSGHMESVAAAIIQNAYREYLQRRRRLTSEAATEQLALNGKPPHAPFGSNDNGSIAAVTPDTSTNTPPTTTTPTLTSKVNWFVGNDPIVPTATTSTPNENESLIAVVDPLNGSSSSSSTNLIDSACEEDATVQNPTPEQSENVDSPNKRIFIGNTLNNATDVTLEKQGTGLASAGEGETQREEDAVKAKGEAEIATEQVNSGTEVLSAAEHVNGETEAGTERVKRETGDFKDEDSKVAPDPVPTCMGLSEFLSEFLQKERDNALPQPPSQTNPDSENVPRLVVPSLAAPQDTPIPYEKMPPVNLESNDSLSSTSLDGSTTDLEDSSLDTITEKLQMQQDETIDRMAKRRASQPKIEVALEQLKAATHFEEPQIKALADNDEEDSQIVMQPLRPDEESRQSSADSATVVMGPHADEIGENFTTEPVFKGAFKRLHTIAGGDERSLFKSVTIDDTVQYIEPSSGGGTSGSSFCLDDDTTAEIRHKMLAYSMSEGDSDYMGVRSSVMGVSTDERLPSLALDDFNITTALGDTVGTSTDTESTIVSAATKIQAGARGFLARRRLQRFSGGTKSSFQTDHKASFGNAAIDESLERLVEDVAAKKIQNAYRKHYRKTLKQRQADAGQSMESSLAAKRMTLQRGDALRNYSTPDEETDASESGVGAKAKEVSLKEPPKKGKSAVSPRDRSVPRWPTRRQYSMPVQIESEIFRVIPKHRRKRIRSAEAEKK